MTNKIIKLLLFVLSFVVVMLYEVIENKWFAVPGATVEDVFKK